MTSPSKKPDSVGMHQAIKDFLQDIHYHGFTAYDLAEMDPPVFRQLSTHWSTKLYNCLFWIITLSIVLGISLSLLLVGFLFMPVIQHITTRDSRMFPEPESFNSLAHYLAAPYMFLTSGGNWDALEEEKCLWHGGGVALDLLRPLQDCAFCAKLLEISRVSNISREEFTSKFAYSRIPVVVSNATTNWTASRVFSFSMLKRLYLTKAQQQNPPSYRSNQGQQEDEDDLADQFFPYKSGFATLREFFSQNDSKALDFAHMEKPWYVGWSNSDPTVGDLLRQHYSRPQFLPQYSEASNLDWIFMGAPGHGANMHVDNVEQPSWQAQLQGTKRWTLQPPFECRHTCKDSLQVTVEPGDIIVLDTNVWYHATEVLGQQMSITIGSEFD